MAVNGGLFSYAGNAAHDTELAKQDELKIAEGGIEVDGKKYDSPQDFVDGIESGSTPKYSPSLLDSDGVLTKNAIYDTVEIPRGFKVSDNPLENTKAGGLVIQDKDGNEFVWIPVEYTAVGDAETNENKLDSGFLAVFYRTQWSNNARTTGSSTSFTEPYARGYENEDTEYYNMMKSVQEHKGFYIGRYEAGTTEVRTTSSSGTESPLIIKRDVYPYNYVKWGDSMKSVGEVGAVYLSKKMYKDNPAVTSTLCYGVQWDAMLDFIKDENHNVTSSADWGNYGNTNADKWKITRTTAQYYKDNKWNPITEELTKAVAGNVLLTTGANDNFKAKNIFDVAGNCWELTMEADSASFRVGRGGFCYDPGVSVSASIHNSYYPTDSGSSIGFRPTLYL